MELQRELSAAVVKRRDVGEVRGVAGIDVGFPRGSTRAAIAVLSYPELRPLEQATIERPTRFPYVPGLLSFREAPAVVEAFERLETKPDLLIVDGQGYAHPRRFGLACHVGVWLDLPTIGSAKSLLVGRHGPVPDERGAASPIFDHDELVGMAVRTRQGVRPLYVSIGHRVDLDTAVEYVLACCRGYRLPEPQRAAHRLASGR
jgi:deoxyribonuclease V